MHLLQVTVALVKHGCTCKFYTLIRFHYNTNFHFRSKKVRLGLDWPFPCQFKVSVKPLTDVVLVQLLLCVKLLWVRFSQVFEICPK